MTKNCDLLNQKKDNKVISSSVSFLQAVLYLNSIPPTLISRSMFASRAEGCGIDHFYVKPF